jgi:fructoselysine 6-kinase
MLKIAAIGDNCVDIYSGDDVSVYVGGNAVNVSVALSRNGIDAAYIGMVGDDAYGTLALKTLRKEKVNTESVIIRRGETGWTKIAVHQGDRLFIGENIAVQANFDLAEINLEYLKTFKLLHYTGFTNWPSAANGCIKNYHEYIHRQLYRLRKATTLISMDFSDRDDEALFAACSGLVDLAFISRPILKEEEIIPLINRLLKYGFRLVVITMGIGGSAAGDGASFWRQPAIPVIIADTLGAGDAFIGAFLSQWTQNTSVECSLLAATKYAAFICSRKGAF